MIGELALILANRSLTLQLAELKAQLNSSRYLNGALQRTLDRDQATHRNLSDRYNDLHREHEMCVENKLRLVRTYSDRCNRLEDRAERAEATLHDLQAKLRALLPHGELLPCDCSVCRKHRTPEEDPADNWPYDSGDVYCGLCGHYGCSVHP